MDPHEENEIAIRDKMIKGLENEIRIQDELIKAQKTMIQALEDQNAELTEILDEIFKP